MLFICVAIFGLLTSDAAEKAELKKAKQTLEEQVMKMQMQKPVDAAEEDQKKVPFSFCSSAIETRCL